MGNSKRKWKTSIRKLFLEGSITVRRAILELTWNNRNIITDSLLIKQIEEDNALSEKSIHCANDRKIDNWIIFYPKY